MLTGENIAVSTADPTPISSAIKYCTNPNLLDNWYFSNPVDQRGGYVITPNTRVYSDAELTDLLATAGPNEYVQIQTITEITNTYVKFIDSGGSVRYTEAAQMPTRGYINSGYGIDRWFLSNTDGMILIQDDGLNITLDKRCNYSQRLPISLSGKTVTFSILAENVVGPAYISIRKYNFEWFGDVSRIPIHDGLTTITYTIPAESADNRMVCISNIDDVSQVSAKVKAAKLELGPTQTLAHQENGQWVLNEIPEYGEQLAKCQRYFYRWPYLVQYMTLAVNGGFGMADFQFPVTMRIIPTITNVKGANTDLSTFSFIVAQNGVHFQNSGTNMVAITNFDVVADL